MISIFAKQAFLNTNPGNSFVSKAESYKGNGHLQRVSSMIRGDQIVDEIGARFNPENGYENNVNIYVKPHVKKGMDFKFEGRKAYLDIIDGHILGELVLKHPEIGVIVCSRADEETMKKSVPNEVVYIPQHHCNYGRLKRTREGVKAVGVIGTESSFEHLLEGLEEELSKRNIKLIKFSKFFSRKDIIDFYMSIDIQLVWRPYKKRLSNPLKIVNAMSFGIPTIALDEPAFKEVDGCYMPASDLINLLANLDSTINYPSLYKVFSERCIEKSEQYHINTVGKLYRRLDK